MARKRGTQADLLVLHGKLRQYRHDFVTAMADFDLALKADPANFGARAWRIAILLVQADYAGARRECGLLAPHASELQAIACVAQIDATTGNARPAYARLSAALKQAGDIDPGHQLWIRTRLAEMAWRFGDNVAAERQFRMALALGIDDNFPAGRLRRFPARAGPRRRSDAAAREMGAARTPCCCAWRWRRGRSSCRRAKNT